MTELQVKIWVSLQTQSRRAITREKTRGGRLYSYRPRGNLLKRIADEHGLSISEVYKHLQAIRKYQLKQP